MNAKNFKHRTHSFSFELVGKMKGNIGKVIIIDELFDKCQYHFLNNQERYFKNGRWWCYFSAEDLHEKYTYLNRRSIDRWLKELENDEWIESGSFNQMNIDRTKWYSVDFEKYMSIGQNDQTIGQNGLMVGQNGQSHIGQNGQSHIGQNGQPIPIPSLPSTLPPRGNEIFKIKIEELSNSIDATFGRKKLFRIIEPTQFAVDEALGKFSKWWLGKNDLVVDLSKSWQQKKIAEDLEHWVQMILKHGKEQKPINSTYVENLKSLLLQLNGYIWQQSDDSAATDLSDWICKKLQWMSGVNGTNQVVTDADVWRTTEMMFRSQHFPEFYRGKSIRTIQRNMNAIWNEAKKNRLEAQQRGTPNELGATGHAATYLKYV